MEQQALFICDMLQKKVVGRKKGCVHLVLFLLARAGGVGLKRHPHERTDRPPPRCKRKFYSVGHSTDRFSTFHIQLLVTNKAHDAIRRLSIGLILRMRFRTRDGGLIPSQRSLVIV